MERINEPTPIKDWEFLRKKMESSGSCMLEEWEAERSRDLVIFLLQEFAEEYDDDRLAILDIIGLFAQKFRYTHPPQDLIEIATTLEEIAETMKTFGRTMEAIYLDEDRMIAEEAEGKPRSIN